MDHRIKEICKIRQKKVVWEKLIMATEDDKGKAKDLKTV